MWGWIESAASAVKAVAAGKAVSIAKAYAGKALRFIAENGEKFVEGVKETWGRVKPIIEKHVKPWLDRAEQLAKYVPFPWVATAVSAINRGVEALLALENSPVLKKVEEAILWATEKAKEYKDYFLTEEEMKAAREQKQALQEAAEKLVDADQKKAFSLAEMIHNFILVRSEIKLIFEKNSVRDLDHYLRLRATQKLLNTAQERIDAAQTADEISNEDLFILQVAENLISDNPTLTDADAEHLERIVAARFDGKTLLSFVFEEMVMAWSSSLETMEQEWQSQNKAYAKDRALLRRLEQTIKLGGTLDAEESVLIKDLEVSVPVSKESLDRVADRILAKKKYIYASEGLLQVLENKEIDGYLIDGAQKVGALIVELSQGDNSWADLSEERQSLINDYANIFEEASKSRAAELVKVAV